MYILKSDVVIYFQKKNYEKLETKRPRIEIRNTYFTVVPISAMGCSCITYEGKEWHFTPPKDYRNDSKVPSKRAQGDTRTTRNR